MELAERTVWRSHKVTVEDSAQGYSEAIKG
jgi:hypothetical protein